jgi:hypothetical protein
VGQTPQGERQSSVHFSSPAGPQLSRSFHVQKSSVSEPPGVSWSARHSRINPAWVWLPALILRPVIPSPTVPSPIFSQSTTPYSSTAQAQTATALSPCPAFCGGSDLTHVGCCPVSKLFLIRNLLVQLLFSSLPFRVQSMSKAAWPSL